MLDYNGIVRSLKLRIGISNRADKNQILERPVHKIVLLVEKQVSLIQDDFMILGEVVVDARSQKRALKWSA